MKPVCFMLHAHWHLTRASRLLAPAGPRRTGVLRKTSAVAGAAPACLLRQRVAPVRGHGWYEVAGSLPQMVRGGGPLGHGAAASGRALVGDALGGDGACGGSEVAGGGCARVSARGSPLGSRRGACGACSGGQNANTYIGPALPCGTSSSGASPGSRRVAGVRGACGKAAKGQCDEAPRVLDGRGRRVAPSPVHSSARPAQTAGRPPGRSASRCHTRTIWTHSMATGSQVEIDERGAERGVFIRCAPPVLDHALLVWNGFDKQMTCTCTVFY